MTDAIDYEVIVVGAGPVGMTLAALLAQSGRTVRIIDRFDSLYGQPRAAHFDDEIARIFAGIGLADRLATFSQPSNEYEWKDADGNLLLSFDFTQLGQSGWPQSNAFTQQRLEAELEALIRTLATVTLSRGEQALSIQDGEHAVMVDTDGTHGKRRFSAQYVVGCDGTNSFVRTQMDVSTTDLGFFYDWLICDVVTNEERTWYPTNLQICDPIRPTSVLCGGPGRRRWEFMRMPNETIVELNDPDTAWRLLEPWNIRRDNSRLERLAVYTFQAQWVDNWRQGHVLLAGDAAHQMPPFAGQGMCSGIRDAANLAWKLNLVLTNVAADDLLDTYSSERLAHVQNAIGMSIELGKVICELDPDRVVERNIHLRSVGPRPEDALGPVPVAALGKGVVLSDKDGSPVRPAGLLSFQGVVTGIDGRQARLDQIVGSGVRIAVIDDPRAHLAREQRDILDAVDGKIVHFVDAIAEAIADDPHIVSVIDSDNNYISHLRAHDDAAVLIRPDYYVFGVIHSLEQLPALLDDFHSHLTPLH